MKKYSTFVGMDVHKNSIEIAIAERGRNGGVRSYGKIDGTLNALDKVVRKLVSKGGNLHFVYEAGPCGYGIYRHLTAKGYEPTGGTGPGGGGTCACDAPDKDDCAGGGGGYGHLYERPMAQVADLEPLVARFSPLGQTHTAIILSTPVDKGARVPF